MQFLYPYFLWALAIIAIPIIIHLFYFRRFKKVYFTNVRFLKSIKEETAARSKLRNLLVLLARIGALVCLVLAFALPFLHNDEARIGRKASSIFIDNSFSMEAKAEDVILLEKAKAFAREIVLSHNEDDVIQILTHDFEGRHQRLVDREEALSLIEEVEISPSVRTLENIEKRQIQLLENESVEYRNIYWLSDFQKSITNVDIIQDTGYHYYALPLQSVEESNVSIDSVWLSSPVARLNESNEVFIKLSNRGNSNAENVRLAAFHDNQEKPISIVDLEAGQTMTDTFRLSITKAGWQNLEIKLTDHPVTFDDQYFMAFDVAESLQILVLSDDRPNNYLRAALESMDNVQLTSQSAKQVDYRLLGQQDMVILENLSSISTGLAGELQNYLEEGGNVLLFPSKNANISEYNNFLQNVPAHLLGNINSTNRSVSYVNTEEFIFDDVFSRINQNVRLPEVFYSYELNRGRGIEERLLRFRDGGSYISKFSKGDGRLYLCASPIDKSSSTLAQNAEIFIPMLYKMALSKSNENKMAFTIGQDDVIDLQGNWDLEANRLEINGAVSFIPGLERIGKRQVISMGEQIKKDGIYELNSGGQLIQLLAFNYDRKESELQYWRPAELQEKWNGMVDLINSDTQVNLAQVLKESEEGRPLWKWLLIFTLVFLAIEQLLLRFWKI